MVLFPKIHSKSGSEVRQARLAKLGLAGLVVGLVALVFPGVWGNGYDISNKILQEDGSYSDLISRR